jgi:restriction system protein
MLNTAAIVGFVGFCEEAGRGILVTTSHYGRSAHEFARDKEITLVDGAGLLHLLQNHGHRVRIDPSEA